MNARKSRSARRLSSTVALGMLAMTTACSYGGSEMRSAPLPGEMIPVGYGMAHKRNVTTSIASVVPTREIASRFATVEEMLEGRVAGLDVLRGPGGFSIRIRGATSLLMSNEPLVVIDGIPIHSYSASSALAGVTPQSVERIDVLKDAGSTAIYGSRGANGVILITTRRGR